MKTATLILAVCLAVPALGRANGLFDHLPALGRPKPAAAPATQTGALAARISQAIDERRYVDAGTLLDQAVVADVKAPELTVLRGELLLARGRFAEALDVFRSVATEPAQKARALEGEGLAFSLLGRSADALASLTAATALDKTAWRAWNGLGREYDLRGDWARAKSAYASAMAAPGANLAIVLNNRGYSQLLQHKNDLASADFVAALDRDPTLNAARTNLRITLAMEGAYERASVVGVGDDRAAVLNNVGLTAAMRGDYLEADRLLNQAMAAKGQFYGRASENLQLSRDLASRADAAPRVTNAAR